jgi:outer membrane receptor protein involved in Fe transport
MRFILLFFLVTNVVFSQRTISGKITDKDTSTPLAGVFIKDIRTESWSFSDSQGGFILTLPYYEDAELNFSLLGKMETNIVLKNDQNFVTVALENNTLHLKEVVVTANKQKQYSELTLGKNAINNVQAFSLDDVLLQLPGQTTTTFNLNQFKNIVFRSASVINYDNKAFGTSFVINDIPISNNENMQALNPNSSGPYGSYAPNTFGINATNQFSNANHGVDLREISTNNIDEVKVIQGIPSAKYGDLTSGLVLITTKVGRSPFRVSASIRDASTELNLTKGVKFNPNNSMNLGLNYLDSKADPRSNILNYQRVNGNLSWLTKNSASSIKNTLSTSFRSNLDNAKSDPDDIFSAVIKNEKKGISISNNFMWKPNNFWVNNININSGFNYDKQYSSKEKWNNTSVSAATNSYEEGIREAYMLPSQYISVSTVEGIPISTFISLEASKAITNKSKWVHSVVFGLSTRTSSNKGAGRQSGVSGLQNFYTLAREGDNLLGYRDYNFNKTRTESQISAYFEDRIFKKFENEQILNVDLGLRYDNQSGYSSFQPRINSSFSINKMIRLRGGLGLSSKSPSLNQVYTGDRYIDRLIGDGIYTYPGVYQKAWIQTIITSGDNLNLKPSKSYRTEAGIDINLSFATINLTAYYNKLYNGFTNQKLPVYREVPKVKVAIEGSQIPTYEIIGTQKFYYFTNSITNGTASEDKGAEVLINFQKIEPLNLDFSMNASYVKSKDFSDTKEYLLSTNLLSESKYGVYNPRTINNDSFNMSFNFNYHIPSAGLLIGVRSEHILSKTSKSSTNNYPNGYLDNELVYHEIPSALQNDLKIYGDIIKNLIETNSRQPKILHNFHLRVSKDFLNGFGVSLYATNFLNLKPYYYNQSGLKVRSEIANFSFGTKLNYEF